MAGRWPRTSPRTPSGADQTLTLGLVLGAGGTVGLAYHAGVLRALEVEGGLVPDSADLVVGTSAGSVIAAYLRSGWTTDQLWDVVLSSDRLPSEPESDVELSGLPRLFVAAARTPLDVMRRTAGSAYVMSRSVLRMPLPALPAPLRRAFPGGMFTMLEGRRRFEAELPSRWPDRDLWLCAVDIVSGRRIVLGRHHPPSIGLVASVLASCAIPGVYPPVRYGRRELIDGGAHSSTNLDLAARYGCDVILAIVPMGYSESDRPGAAGRLTRRLPNSTLAAEMAVARTRRARVVAIRPGSEEVRLHGVNMMRSDGLLEVAEAAFESTTRRLRSGGDLTDALEFARDVYGRGSMPATTL